MLSSLMTSSGHESTHVPHPLHNVESIRAIDIFKTSISNQLILFLFSLRPVQGIIPKETGHDIFPHTVTKDPATTFQEWVLL
jgi:hypothetical protein